MQEAVSGSGNESVPIGFREVYYYALRRHLPFRLVPVRIFHHNMQHVFGTFTNG